MDGESLEDANKQESVKALRLPGKSDKILTGTAGCSSICQLPDVVCSLSLTYPTATSRGNHVSASQDNHQFNSTQVCHVAWMHSCIVGCLYNNANSSQVFQLMAGTY